MQLETYLKQGISDAILDLYDVSLAVEDIKLEVTNADFKGDFTFVCFPIVRFSKKKPEETAHELGVYIKQNIDQVSDFNIVKGFLNFEISHAYWLEYFKVYELKYKLGNKGKVMVEYSSPNTNKPLHLGHVRNNLLGFAVASILEASGYDVIKSNLINDRGIHICKSMIAWQKFGNGETPESTGMKGDHLVGKYYVEFDKHYKSQINQLVESGVDKEKAEKEAPLLLEAQEMLIKWENGDPETIELWKTMNAWVYAGFDVTYKALGVSFDQYYYESQTYLLGKDIIEEGLKMGVFFKKPDNSVWIDLKDHGLDEKLVLRGDGTSVYITQDIGTAQRKFEQFKCDKSIYVVGNEQDYHFKVLFLILQKMGRTWASGLHHLSYGMVDLPSGKMKSREGTVVDADDLMSEMIAAAKEKTEELGKTDGMPEDEKQELFKTLGMGALKFFILKVDPQKRMLFNPAESIDLQGDTGPFVQYTYARIQSIFRAAKPEDCTYKYSDVIARESEINLIKCLLNFESEVLKAANSYSPAILISYALDLAKAFNRLYNDVSILKEEDSNLRQFRLKLSRMTGDTLKHVLHLVGINCPDRM
ncbi:MAG: arginine--tRNA ligase [Bacteroidia bacterium]|nr:arginine--tRNA ligase [Bacteroidia bacterium]